MDAKDRLKLNFDAPQFGSVLSILGLIEIAGLNETRWKGYFDDRYISCRAGVCDDIRRVP